VVDYKGHPVGESRQELLVGSSLVVDQKPSRLARAYIPPK